MPKYFLFAKGNMGTISKTHFTKSVSCLFLNGFYTQLLKCPYFLSQTTYDELSII